MPEVLGHGVWPFGEQWLWEAVGESYLRVADVVRGHAVTLGVTPVLAGQLDQMKGAPGDRYLRWIAENREYFFDEDMRSYHGIGRGDLTDALAPQLEDHRRAAERFAGELERDLPRLLAALAASGVELLAGPATHPVMPLLASDFGRDLQLGRGLEEHRNRFGAARGIWLPECAFSEGLDPALARAGVEYFCVDQSAIHGETGVENMEPVATPAGPLALPIDWQMIKLVWGEDGYPSATSYRSTFARTTHGLMPHDNGGGAWSEAAARAQADAHADAFLRALSARLEFFRDERGRAGTSIFAVDTELLGHWWYEGPWWLAAVIERAASYGIELVTLGELAESTEPVERRLQQASWGRDKDLSTWDSPQVAAIAFAQRRAELEFEQATCGTGDLALAERELLALQASDWAFMESGARAGDYGAKRFNEHLAAFTSALIDPEG
jgi:1,4-alpha-glucan branching enzyme